MKLPSLDTYAFPVTVPSTNKTISMRPFLVREEKLLLMAQESGDVEQQIESVAQVVKNCTNDAIDPQTAPYFDVEYLLLQLRIRSVGEMATPVYRCNNRISDTDVCGHETTVQVNLSTITVNNLEANAKQFEVELSDQYTLHLRYPTIYTIHKLTQSLTDGKKYTLAMDSVADTFDLLTDNKTNTVYKFSDYTYDEKIQFLESLNTESYAKCTDFMINMPSLFTTVKYTCAKCGFAHELELERLTDFLV